MAERSQSKGRETNAAQPPANLPGSTAEPGHAKTAARSRVAAGPDGPDAGVIGKTFKKRPS
jgi:hypothetical protein